MSRDRRRSLAGRVAARLTAGGAALLTLVVLLGAGASAAAARGFPDGPARSAVVWAVGDGAFDTDGVRAVAALLARERPDRFVYLGDVYEFGSAANFRDHYTPHYGTMQRITLPTPGNHEWPNHALGYDPYWAPVTGLPVPHRYSVRIAGWQVLSVNSEQPAGAGSVQRRWLARQVRGRGNCRIAFWHRPRYSAGQQGDQADMDAVWRTLRGRAAIVLNGHDHNLQRMRRRDGITQFVVGAGGRSLYPVDADDRRLAFSNDDAYGALRLGLRPGLARFRFVTADGRTLDAGSVRCRRR